MFRAPSDEIVELKIGPQYGAWEPLPPEETAGIIMVPALPTAVNLLALFVSFIAAGAALIGAIILTKNPVPGIASGVIVLGAGFFSLSKFSNAVYRSRRMGVFEQGIRFGRDLIRFEDLKLLALEAPKTVAERHLPTLRKMQQSIGRTP